MEEVEKFFNQSLPSVQQQLHHPHFEQAEIEVWVKRDDLLHPVISGNKWRKLKYPLMQAASEGKRHIVSFGGAYSNHLPALAAACRQLGFGCTGFVRGEELNADSNPQLRYCSSQGMQLLFVSREAYRNKPSLFQSLSGRQNSFFLDEGGFSSMGARGCEAVVTELIQPFNHLILPVGTGTTMAGIANALHHLNKPTKVHGVVTLKDAEYLSARIRTLSAESINWQLHHGYHHGGFAKTSKALLQFIADKQTELQLPFEPVYSGKMVFAFWQMLTNRVFVPGEKVLLVHTGGVSV